MSRCDLGAVLRPADCLIIVPPFAGLDRPSLAAHLLQACAREAGLSVGVLYANVLLAAEMGELNYQALCYAPFSGLIGERFFASAAYGVGPFGREGLNEAAFHRMARSSNLTISLDELERIEARAAGWADEVAGAITRVGYAVVGCTTTFQQTSASVALLNRVKRFCPSTVTVLGGGNCDGQMAEGVCTLGAAIDVVFSGESEEAFPRFLKAVRAGAGHNPRIVRGQPCLDLDRLPTPSFEEFYEQYALALRGGPLEQMGNVWLPFETSRGCWWGEKHHCTFCGLNGQTMTFRAKSPDRALEELKALLPRHPTNKVTMVDNIMPRPFFRTLLPRLGAELPGLHVFYEQKSNLTLDNVVALKSAGVGLIQPGIEALSTALLKRMDKGVSGPQNLALLRYARAAEVAVNWNLLYAFPGDGLREYEETIRLLPLLRHLHPPVGISPLSIDRFSPYFNHPARYGVSNIRPLDVYRSILPAGADASKVAYNFVADYASEVKDRPDVVRELRQESAAWRAAWESETAPPPVLAVSRLGEDTYLLVDTRGLPGTCPTSFIDEDTAAVALAGWRGERTAAANWALANGAAVEMDGWVVPLATASPELIREFEARRRPAARRVELETVGG
jgi:ribosomal peptide maturation radical SAM protein 1